MSVPIRRIGIPDEFVEQGTQAELRAMLGIDAAGLVATIHQALNENRLVASIG